MNNRAYKVRKRMYAIGALPCFLIFALVSQSHAATITQSFASEWTVDSWSYYGNVAALEWHYLEYEPWDSSLGELKEVRVETNITGQRALASESLRIRYSFSTGWSPANYQFHRSFEIPAGTADFSVSESFLFDTPAELDQWINYAYYPPADYYFESRTIEAGHSISALTTLTYTYTSLESLLCYTGLIRDFG